MDYIQILLCTIVAYLIGAIPSSVWISKLYYGIDIRDHGSGTASHTNVHRILGRRSGLMVRLIDVLKGFFAANLAMFVHHKYGIFSDMEFPILMMTFGLSAIMGHIFPIFAGFRGGKGYHVTLGIIIAISPLASLVSVSISALIFLLFRYPNLGYVAGGLAIPVFVIASRHIYTNGMYIPTLIFSLCLSLVLLMTHRSDLRLILKGEEDRASLL